MIRKIVVYRKINRVTATDIELLNAKGYATETTKKGYWRQFQYFRKNKFDVYYLWFCNIYGVIPYIFARINKSKFVIFAGGYDACAITKLGYGVFLKNNIRTKIIKYLYNHADKVICPSQDLKDKLSKFVYCDIDVIHLAIDSEYFTPQRIERDIDYLTIANTPDSKTFYRKNIEQFFDMAWSMLEYSFVWVGRQVIKPYIIPPNMMIIEDVSDKKLFELLNRSTHYCQFSLYESFGYSVLEAMSMGCIPIVSDVGMMKKIAGDSKTHEEARQRVVRMFSIEKRKKLINNL